MFTRKPRLRLGKFLISCAKRLLQQYRHFADIPVKRANRSDHAVLHDAVERMDIEVAQEKVAR
jgi:hypothetical protein